MLSDLCNNDSALHRTYNHIRVEIAYSLKLHVPQMCQKLINNKASGSCFQATILLLFRPVTEVFCYFYKLSTVLV